MTRSGLANEGQGAHWVGESSYCGKVMCGSIMSSMPTVNQQLIFCTSRFFTIGIVSLFFVVCGRAVIDANALASSAEDSSSVLANLSPAERFKTFLSSPAVVESLVFSERLAPDPKTPWRTDIPLTNSTSFRYYEARWQPGAFFLREIAAPDALSDPVTPGLLAVHFGDQCWFHYGRGLTDDFIDYGAGASNHVCEVVKLNSGVLKQVMTLGIMHCDIGSIEWTGDHCSVRSAPDEYQTSGDLHRSSEGLVDSVRVTYSNDKGEIHWVIRYHYQANSTTPWFPSFIRCYWLDGANEIERDEFQVFTIKIRNKASDFQSFQPESLIRANQWQIHLFTNNAIFAVLPGGQLKKLKDVQVEAAITKGRGKVLQLATVYSSWAVLNLGIFILMVRMIVKAKPKAHTESETHMNRKLRPIAGALIVGLIGVANAACYYETSYVCQTADPNAWLQYSYDPSCDGGAGGWNYVYPSSDWYGWNLHVTSSGGHKGLMPWSCSGPAKLHNCLDGKDYDAGIWSNSGWGSGNRVDPTTPPC